MQALKLLMVAIIIINICVICVKIIISSSISISLSVLLLVNEVASAAKPCLAVTTDIAFYIQSLDLLLFEFFKYLAEQYGILPV